MWERNSYTLLVGMEISATTVKSSTEVPQNKKSKNRTTLLFSDTIPVAMYPKECKSRCNKDTCMPTFIAALFIITKL
jgi:hypothetical protein